MFSAAVLAQLEDDLGGPILTHFDLVAGTSTGGIIALALGAGMTPKKIVEFYVELGPRVFAHPRRKTAGHVVRSKYRARPLRHALDEILGERRLCDSVVPLCVPSYDLRADDVHLFRTPHSDRLVRDWRETMVDVAMATSAAPTFLPAHKMRGLRLVDGGVWANNPAVVAVSEAVSEFGIDLADIRLLSLGTTSDVGARPERLDRGGLLAWATSAAPLILRGQSRAAENATYHLLPKGRAVRINPSVPDKMLRLDGVTPDELMGRAEHESRLVNGDVRRVFYDHAAGRYAPCHTLDQETSP
jgi:patatin-like phospholipase/acyl hydrolase